MGTISKDSKIHVYVRKFFKLGFRAYQLVPSESHGQNVFFKFGFVLANCSAKALQ